MNSCGSICINVDRPNRNRDVSTAGGTTCTRRGCRDVSTGIVMLLPLACGISDSVGFVVAAVLDVLTFMKVKCAAREVLQRAALNLRHCAIIIVLIGRPGNQVRYIGDPVGNLDIPSGVQSICPQSDTIDHVTYCDLVVGVHCIDILVLNPLQTVQQGLEVIPGGLAGLLISLLVLGGQAVEDVQILLQSGDAALHAAVFQSLDGSLKGCLQLLNGGVLRSILLRFICFRLLLGIRSRNFLAFGSGTLLLRNSFRFLDAGLGHIRDRSVRRLRSIVFRGESRDLDQAQAHNQGKKQGKSAFAQGLINSHAILPFFAKFVIGCKVSGGRTSILQRGNRPQAVWRTARESSLQAT